MGSNLNAVETKLTIAGKPCHFSHLTLNQRFNAHHTFEIKVDYQELDDRWMENPVKIIRLMGEEVTITMQHKETGEQNLFKGIITHVSMSGRHGEQNYIIVYGNSPTIKLDGMPAMDSFMDLPLKNIINEAVGTSGNGGEITVKPVFKGKIDYICQYNESAFSFVNRLSALYSEWFLYDGTTCYFGKPDLGEVKELTYDVEITHIDFSARLAPPKVKRYDYLVHDDNEVDSDTPETVDGVRGYIQAALDQSNSLYPSEATLPLAPSISTKKDLDDMVKAEKYRMVSNMLTISARSQSCKVRLGKCLKVKLPNTMKVALKEVETFLVTEVTHDIDQNGTYINNFRGIPSEMENIPMDPIATPVAYPQIGWVKTNADDKKLGRVKVQTQWQKKSGKTTNWIRIQTSDAGKSDKVLKNRGLVTIPEANDMIMLGFEYGDPNRPYVAGSIFPENVSIGGKETNKIKSYTTRMGSTVTYDDAEHTIEISTSQKNKFFIEEQKGAITITADTSITLNAGETIDLNTKHITFNGSKSVSTHSPEIKIGFHGEKYPNKTIDLAGEKITTKASKNILEQAPDIDIEGSKTVTIKTKKMKLSGSSKIDLSSPKIDSN